ncbi:DNA helicase II [Thiomicrospira sp. ALE5]|uniref:DNA helicase II n=1 Tax=Thiomicrospira sp. ALE5 TaxID=748650 RepID=UPI0008E7C1BD|nr:DNA helicase II [Thiomicrospira sp. ALE5]SFR55892.1 DNA helicase-2 / ATP-dependent DNA helicase PcrA [Thiomicrospira sp. ALE5]
MDVSYILDGLNDAQRQAVTLESGHGLVLAGAGSGKTRVLVHRIAWLVEVMGVSPYNVLAVTFTNKAAREMRGRMEALMGPAAKSVTMGTFHGIAYQLLRQHYQAAGLPQAFQILDSDDQKRLVKRLLKAMNLDETQWPVKQVVGFINGEKEEGRRSKHVDVGHNPYLKTLVAVYQAYEQQCQQAGLVDFAELLLRAHELWLRAPEVLAFYQQRYQHILVDEFQDTNSLQYAWLRVLAGGRGRLFVVGDDDQSIYGWRGAKVENIRLFEQQFADVTLVRLEQNYRSTNRILQAANQLIAHNTERLGKNLWSDGEPGEPILIYEAFNDLDECQYVLEQIQAWLREGGAREEVAILYRSNAQSRVFEQGLLQAEMPYRIYGGLRFYDRAEIKDVLAYLRLVMNSADDAAFERVYNLPTRGLGDKTMQQVRDIARDQACSMWAASEWLLDHGGLTARAKGALRGFLNLITELASLQPSLALADFVLQVMQDSGLQAHFEKDRSEQGQSRLENLDELVNAAASFEKRQDLQADGESDNSLLNFLAQATLEAGDNQASAGESAIQLMTLHAAKGLEFPLVFMVGMEEGLFPSQSSQDDPARLEEERRLAYVGITRAERRLFMCAAQRRRLHGNEIYSQPSRFLRELPDDAVQWVRMKSAVQSTRSWAADASTAAKAQQNDTGLRLGQAVFHQKFGPGVVMATEGSGDHARIQVSFKQAGVKWLVMAYANLTPV